MKVALIGATGKVGRPIAQEAVARGHEVLALLRPKSSLLEGRSISAREVDIFDAHALGEAVRGCDAIVSAYGAPAQSLHLLAAAAESIVKAARQAGVRRIVLVGGAGGLEVAPGVRLADTPDFPATLQPKVVAHSDAISVLRAADDLDWTCVAPAAQIGLGDRIGRYRSASGRLVADAKGQSCISYADFACAVLDQLESDLNVRQVLGIGY